jgi:hypothetical protein
MVAKMPEGIKQLKDLAIAHSRTKYPTMPEYARCSRNYTDRTANGLTRCIIDYLNFAGQQAERINSTGRPIDNTKIVKDVLGSSRRIGSMKWIPGTGQKGTADISATIHGKSVKIEVKIKDKQSEAQKIYQAQIERAGGFYWICRSFEEFLNNYNSIV